MAVGRSFGTVESRRWEELKKKLRLSLEERAVLAEFLYGRFRNGAGILHLPVPLPNIADAVGLPEERTGKALEGLQDKGLLVIDWDNSVIACPEYWRHSQIYNGKQAIKICRIILDLPDNAANGPMLAFIQEEAERVRRDRPAKQREDGRTIDYAGWYDDVAEALMGLPPC